MHIFKPSVSVDKKHIIIRSFKLTSNNIIINKNKKTAKILDVDDYSNVVSLKERVSDEYVKVPTWYCHIDKVLSDEDIEYIMSDKFIEDNLYALNFEMVE